jgi:hypothetical protein
VEIAASSGTGSGVIAVPDIFSRYHEDNALRDVGGVICNALEIP